MRPQTFVKKPAEIGAIQFVDNGSADEIADWLGEDVRLRYSPIVEWMVDHLLVLTPDGWRRADREDWVVQEQDGGHLSVHGPQYFERTYARKGEDFDFSRPEWVESERGEG